MLHILCYGARQVEEERKKERKKMNNSDFRPFQVCHFKIVILHIPITTADWGRLYKLLDVLLDPRICSLSMIFS